MKVLTSDKPPSALMNLEEARFLTGTMLRIHVPNNPHHHNLIGWLWGGCLFTFREGQPVPQYWSAAPGYQYKRLPQGFTLTLIQD